MTPPESHLPSLLDGDTSHGAPPKPSGRRSSLRAFEARLMTRLDAAWERPLWRYGIMGTSSIAAVALGLVIYLAIRPVPKPDYEQADISRIFNYTLLTDEFNRLPVEERIELIGQLYERVRAMDAAESATMAAFFAGVAGKAREQIEANASKLFLDAADMVAKDYASIPEEEKGAYLEQSLVRLIRLGEAFDGGIANASDEEILEEARENALRDQERMESGEVTAQQASRFMVFMGTRVDRNASGHQRQRINLFMRDLTRQLRSGSP